MSYHTCKYCGAEIDSLRLRSGGAYNGRVWAVIGCSECKKTFNVRGRDKKSIATAIRLYLDDLNRKRMDEHE